MGSGEGKTGGGMHHSSNMASSRTEGLSAKNHGQDVRATRDGQGVRRSLDDFCAKLLPRMLTQVCRDEGAATYGCFDRHYWHYKIRDFPSIILQQGGYALYCASLRPECAEWRAGLQRLAAAACRFWNQKACAYRAFEEYYPWEEGYPPLAFSTLAVAKMAIAGVVDSGEIMPGLRVAARQLTCRFEHEAANQQVAGLAALCCLRNISHDLVATDTLASVTEQTLRLQHPEGWFMEYGGPDLGYLSVTLDCLWDAYDATRDSRFLAAAAAALQFIHPFALMPQRGAGMHNARNTDYLVPYGISRFLSDDKHASMARQILCRIYRSVEARDHFLHAIDDRYFCHYTGHSIFRAEMPDDLEHEACPEQVACYFEGSGHWLQSHTVSDCAVVVSGRKGGICTWAYPDAHGADFGWIAHLDGMDWVSHWWGDFWQVAVTENEVVVKGHLTPHRDYTNSPLKHIVLRVLSFLCGRRIIRLLKERLIFKRAARPGPAFQRTITFTPEGLRITDRIAVKDASSLRRAPRSSKRHVASADSFQHEDMVCTTPNLKRQEQKHVTENQVEITTLYERTQ